MTSGRDDLAERIRSALGPRPGITEQKMFGGLQFLLFGNAFVGAMKNGKLLARHAPGERDAALARPGAEPISMGERLMEGFVGVDGEGIETDAALADWIDYVEAFVKTLPPKHKPGKKP